MLNSLENGRCSFISTTLHLPPLQSLPKICSSISVNFLFSISPLFVHKIILAIPTNTPFYYSTTVLTSLLFTYNHPQNLHQKHFLYLRQFIQFSLSQKTRDLGSIMRTDTFLISSFFVKVWKMIAGFTIADSLSLRLRKLVYSK